MKYLTALLVFWVTASNAQTYNVEFAPIANAYVGQPVTITAWGTSSTGDVEKIFMSANDKMLLPYPGWIYCGACDSLAASASYTAQYPGPVKFDAFIYDSQDKFVKQATYIVNFVCPGEYCPPNPLIGQFAGWMRKKGYDE